MFSKSFGYAARAVVLIAMNSQSGQKTGLADIADELEIPRHFLGKILQDLVRHGIINSVKGPNGGFYANDKTPDTPLIKILLITDGSLVFEHCALGLPRCNAARPCVLHHDFAVCRNAMKHALSEKLIRDLMNQVQSGNSFLV